MAGDRPIPPVTGIELDPRYASEAGFVPNIVHQHILVLRKEPVARQASRRRDSR